MTEQTPKIRTKKHKPKAIDLLIQALKEIHGNAKNIASIIEKWEPGEEISPNDLEKIEKWLRIPKCDESYKIARCVVRCIYDHWLECVDTNN